MADAQLSQDDVQRLVSEHHALDEQIRYLSTQAYLPADQQLTEATLKKKKLAIKDRIEALTRRGAGGRTGS